MAAFRLNERNPTFYVIHRYDLDLLTKFFEAGFVKNRPRRNEAQSADPSRAH